MAAHRVPYPSKNQVEDFKGSEVLHIKDHWVCSALLIPMGWGDQTSQDKAKPLLFMQVQG